MFDTSQRFSASSLAHGIWLFFVLNVYSGTLTSMLTTTTYNFVATSLEDVVANEKSKPLMLKGAPVYGDVMVLSLLHTYVIAGWKIGLSSTLV